MTKHQALQLMAHYRFDRAVFQIRIIHTWPRERPTRARIFLYVDPRAYHEALDQLFGPNWTNEIKPLGSGLTYTLSIQCEDGILARTGVGEPSGSPAAGNPLTYAAAQGLRKACEALGLGRYIWLLPESWADYDPDTRQLRNEKQVLARLVDQLHRAADVNQFVVQAPDELLTPTGPGLNPEGSTSNLPGPGRGTDDLF